MKKVLSLTVAVFVVMSAVVIAASKDYYQQYKAPMYGTYRPANNYAQRPPMYGNKPPMMYGQMLPPPPYGNMQPQKHYGNVPPMYGNHRPPMMYGQKPPMAYGNKPPMYGNRPPQQLVKNQKHYPKTLELFDESRPVAR